MNHSNLIGSENRLIYRVIPGAKKPTRKVVTRTTSGGARYQETISGAQAAAAKQAATHQKTNPVGQIKAPAPTPSDIMLNTPGGTIGYSSANYNPTYDVDGNLNGVLSKTGNQIKDTNAQIDA